MEKKRIDQVLANEEIRTIISALGAGIGSDFNLDNLNYHKVIILSDADQDGMHIRCILLTFFFRYMRPLVQNGHVYIAQPPLYKATRGKEEKYMYSDQELEEYRNSNPGKFDLQRYKGLGKSEAKRS